MIRSEFRKLTTVRAPWLLLAAGPLLVVAGITGLVESGGNVHDPGTQRAALAHTGLAAIFTLRLLPQWAGGLMLLAYAAAFAYAAVFTTLRRDVT